MARDKTETGIAGEFLVAYKLSEMGLETTRPARKKGGKA